MAKRNGGFNFGGMGGGNMQKLVLQAQQMQADAERVQSEIGAMEFSAFFSPDRPLARFKDLFMHSIRTVTYLSVPHEITVGREYRLREHPAPKNSLFILQ